MRPKKRLIFCTYPCLYSSIVLTILLESKDIEVVAIINSSRNLKIKENSLLSSLRRVSQSGISYAVYLWFISQGHSLIARWSTVSSISQIAKRENIQSHTTKDINSTRSLEVINQFKPDIILCAHFNQLVSPKTYSLAKDASLNIHPSLLPDLKGVDPSFYALLRKYQETGVSLHHLAEKFDDGTVISNSSLTIDEDDSLFSLNTKLFQEGGNLMLDFFGTKDKHLQFHQDNDIQSHYDSWPTTSDVAAFKRKRKLLSIKDIKWIFSKPSQ